MHGLLDAAGATLCDPLLIILLAVMMMPSGGGSSYVFSGKTDDVGFLLLKARAAARKLPCAHRRSGLRPRRASFHSERRPADQLC